MPFARPTFGLCYFVALLSIAALAKVDCSKPVTAFKRLARLLQLSYIVDMKTLTVRLPEVLVADIESESRSRRVSKSDVVRERLAAAPAQREHPLADILAEIDRQPVRGPKRDAARDKQRLPEIIRAHYRAAKRHS